MDGFSSVKLRGALKLGRALICLRPSVYVAAAKGAAARGLERLKLPSHFLRAERGAYSIGAPWSADDFAFVARHGGHCRVVIADYAFQAEAAAYALKSWGCMVVMHDLFCQRSLAFRDVGGADATTALSETEELTLLALADVIVAIQSDEAAFISSRLAQKQVLTVPVSSPVETSCWPGEGTELLFVGSNAAPNVMALTWFFEDIWPLIRSLCPDAQLTIVGSVNRSFAQAPPTGVSFVGVVADLSFYYRRAAVVISPLTVGSGMKVKLIEAMAYGKAVVATSITLQGIQAPGAVVVADTADGFAQAVARLLSDRLERRRLGEIALETVAQHFSLQATTAQLVDAARILASQDLGDAKVADRSKPAGRR